jgi:hypothetical protein
MKLPQFTLRDSLVAASACLVFALAFGLLAWWLWHAVVAGRADIAEFEKLGRLNPRSRNAAIGPTGMFMIAFTLVGMLSLACVVVSGWIMVMYAKQRRHGGDR